MLASFRWTAALLLCLLLPGPARSHPISVSEASVYVTRDKVTANLEIYLEDLFLFHNLTPNDRDFLEPDVIEQGIARHQDFLLERFVIRDVAGERLAGTCVDIQRFDMPPEGVPLAESMAHKLTFVMEYLLDAPPEFLTFSQEFLDDKLLVPAEMVLRVKQENAGTGYQQILYPHNPQTVRFSWDNPPLSPEASEEQWQEWLQKQKEETLGITSYSAVYSFLYINDFEVRHEILIPLLTLEESVLIARAGDAFLEVAEQDLAREQIAEFFRVGNPVEIDGRLVEPEIQRLDFYGVDFKDFARPAERRRVSMANARVGIILSYPAAGSPATVRVSWDRFNRYIWAVNMIVYAYDDTLTATLTRIGRQNSFEWQNPGRPAAPPLTAVEVALAPPPAYSLPLVSLGCAMLLPAVFVLPARRAARRFRGPLILLIAGCAAAAWPYARWPVTPPWTAPPRLTSEQAAEVFQTLHQNVYRAFDYRDEQEIYDALALSVDGPLLKDLYLQIRRGLQMEEQGGAVSRIREVQLVQGESLPATALPPSADPRGFAYQCQWTVAGTVEHWGHVHARTNEYQARFLVEPSGTAWKITGLDVQNERRVSFETSLRGL